MVIRPSQFNLYLLLLVTVWTGAGCKTSEPNPDKQTATLRIHLETNPLFERSEQILVLRSAPIRINIESYPFLSETHLTSARLVEMPDGHALAIQFNQQGQRLLEQYSAGNSRRRFAIRTQFRQSTNVFDRWIAAPLIAGRIADGIITFTPDADRAESEIIVRGWNNIAGYKPKAGETKPKFSEVP